MKEDILLDHYDYSDQHRPGPPFLLSPIYLYIVRAFFRQASLLIWALNWTSDDRPFCVASTLNLPERGPGLEKGRGD